jgi:hypothetical protein
MPFPAYKGMMDYAKVNSLSSKLRRDWPMGQVQKTEKAGNS